MVILPGMRYVALMVPCPVKSAPCATRTGGGGVRDLDLDLCLRLKALTYIARRGDLDERRLGSPTCINCGGGVLDLARELGAPVYTTCGVRWGDLDDRRLGSPTRIIWGDLDLLRELESPAYMTCGVPRGDLDRRRGGSATVRRQG